MDYKADVRELTFISTGETAPVVDYESKAQRTSREGVPLWGVRVMVASESPDGGRPELILIKVPSSDRIEYPAGVPLRVLGLRLTPWSRGGSGGVGFRADRIEAISAVPATGSESGSGPGSRAGSRPAGPGPDGRRG